MGLSHGWYGPGYLAQHHCPLRYICQVLDWNWSSQHSNQRCIKGHAASQHQPPLKKSDDWSKFVLNIVLWKGRVPVSFIHNNKLCQGSIRILLAYNSYTKITFTIRSTHSGPRNSWTCVPTGRELETAENLPGCNSTLKVTDPSCNFLSSSIRATTLCLCSFSWLCTLTLLPTLSLSQHPIFAILSLPSLLLPSIR